MAYAILSDPQRRAAFDRGGAGAVDIDEAMASMSVDDLGAMGGVVGGLFSALGVDMPTAVSVNALDAALEGARGAKRLRFGVEESGLVSKGTAEFYRLNVSSEQAANGVAIRAWSTNKSDRLKLLLFDKDNELLWQADGMAQKKGTVSQSGGGIRVSEVSLAEMTLCDFDTVLLGKPTPDFMLEDPDLALFRKLDKLERPPISSIGAGEHLMAVYGDNFVSKTKYGILAVEMDPASENCEAIRNADSALRQKQRELATFEQEYNEAQRAFNAAKERYATEQEELDAALKARTASYGKLFGHDLPAESRRKKDKKEGCSQQ